MSSSPEVPPWLASLPLAPVLTPTLAEFQDPIAYILKIEPSAAPFGICKIVPPLPPPLKKSAIAHLNRSLAARHPNPKQPPTFTTRQQHIGPRRPRPNPVWQSGEHHTLQQFQSKANHFQKSHLKKSFPSQHLKPPLDPLITESLFWNAAAAAKPISVEYANDLPGSAFPPAPSPAAKHWRDEAADADSVGETAWNMRGVSRAKGSLLRFMKEDIPGVTSPMVYIAMMFSWFAWHAEDHELHSLNYLHMGAGKTWYGVPRDARFDFEEVVREHAYGGEVNPLVTFAILNEKTTVMSPEVLVRAGIPCCRLVQNAGEFVVTFPGAYHSGFSHGFNCGEATNIATPEWLRYAKEAAIRRASTNYPPMVSHVQLLYAQALSLVSRISINGGTEPRSSRLKDKMKGEGDMMIKKMFVQNVIENNDLLSILLDKGSPCIVLPQKSSKSTLSTRPLVRPQIKVTSRLSVGLCSHQEALKASRSLPSDDTVLRRNSKTRRLSGFCSLKGNSVRVMQGRRPTSATFSKGTAGNLYSSTSDSKNIEGERETTSKGDELLDQGLLSCVTCGILSFACVAVVQPREVTARYLMSADCGFLNDQNIWSKEINVSNHDMKWKASNLVSNSGQKERHSQDRLDDSSMHCSTHSVEVSDHGVGGGSDTWIQKGTSALDLLAFAYGDSSDSEGEKPMREACVCTDENDLNDSSHLPNQNYKSAIAKCLYKASHGAECEIGVSPQYSDSSSGSDDLNGLRSPDAEDRDQWNLEFSRAHHRENPKSIQPSNSEDNIEKPNSSSSISSRGEPIDASCSELDNGYHTTGISITHQSEIRAGSTTSSSADYFLQSDSCCDSAEPTGNTIVATQSRNSDIKTLNSTISAMKRSGNDSCRMHVFCLEHALEVKKQLQPIGGVHIMLLCHPEYPEMEAEGKLLSEELGICHLWKDIDFRGATEDQQKIQLALKDDEAIPTNSDWAVKLGINLYYSVCLSKSSLYNKQMPYNSVIYKAFGRSSDNPPVNSEAPRRKPGKQKKVSVAGKWCGKSWMSNKLHPYLAQTNDSTEQDDTDKLHSRATDQKSKSGVVAECDNITSARKSGKRRKKLLVKAGTKKTRCTQLEDSLKTVEAKVEISSSCSIVLRSRRNKHINTQCTLSLKDETKGGPCKQLRQQPSKAEEVKSIPRTKKQIRKKEKKTISEELEYICCITGCSMSFATKQDLALHKHDICPVEGCGKKFFSHKYLVQHQKVHMDERPLKCPWKGCVMAFKWPWARTEHIRVHTGDRPYVCRDCDQTFRFVSDFSRHKRKTGHLGRKGRR